MDEEDVFEAHERAQVAAEVGRHSESSDGQENEIFQSLCCVNSESSLSTEIERDIRARNSAFALFF